MRSEKRTYVAQISPRFQNSFQELEFHNRLSLHPGPSPFDLTSTFCKCDCNLPGVFSQWLVACTNRKPHVKTHTIFSEFATSGLKRSRLGLQFQQHLHTAPGTITTSSTLGASPALLPGLSLQHHPLVQTFRQRHRARHRAGAATASAVTHARRQRRDAALPVTMAAACEQTAEPVHKQIRDKVRETKLSRQGQKLPFLHFPKKEN